MDKVEGFLHDFNQVIESGDKVLLENVLFQLDKEISQCADEKCVSLYSTISCLLKHEKFKKVTWDWIVDHSEKSNFKYSVYLSISILESIVERPVDGYLLSKLLDLIKDDNSRLLVLLAYENYPERLHKDLLLYQISKELSEFELAVNNDNS